MKIKLYLTLEDRKDLLTDNWLFKPLPPTKRIRGNLIVDGDTKYFHLIDLDSNEDKRYNVEEFMGTHIFEIGNRQVEIEVR